MIYLLLGGSSHEPSIISGLVHPGCKWTTCPHLSHENNQGYKPLTIRGMNHQVEIVVMLNYQRLSLRGQPTISDATCH